LGHPAGGARRGGGRLALVFVGQGIQGSILVEKGLGFLVRDQILFIVLHLHVFNKESLGFFAGYRRHTGRAEQKGHIGFVFPFFNSFTGKGLDVFVPHLPDRIGVSVDRMLVEFQGFVEV
jgi:hypothetical protein